MSAPIAFATFILICLGFTVWTAGWLRSDARAVHRLSLVFDLPAPDAFRTTVTQRFYRRRVALTGAGVIAILLATAVFWNLYPVTDTVEALSVAAPTFLACLALGSAADSLLTVKGGTPRRAAHVRARALSDYLPALTRGCAWGFVIVGATAWGAAVVIGPLTSAPDSMVKAMLELPLVSLAAALAAIAVAELVSRRVISRGGFAESPVELAWNDAWRSVAIRSLFLAPALLGLNTALSSFAVVGYQAKGPLFEWVQLSAGVLSLGAVCCAIILVVMELKARPESYFRRRLWANGVQG